MHSRWFCSSLEQIPNRLGLAHIHAEGDGPDSPDCPPSTAALAVIQRFPALKAQRWSVSVFNLQFVPGAKRGSRAVVFAETRGTEGEGEVGGGGI